MGSDAQLGCSKSTRMIMPELVNLVRIEQSDGTVYELRGEDAARVFKWWVSCETLAWVHGSEYDGPVLQEVKPCQ